jgi:hypothetical protein
VRSVATMPLISEWALSQAAREQQAFHGDGYFLNVGFFGFDAGEAIASVQVATVGSSRFCVHGLQFFAQSQRPGVQLSVVRQSAAGFP